METTLTETLAAKRERRAEIERDLEDVRARIEESREHLGEAVAGGGEDAAEIREELRDLEIERDGLQSAVPVLEREIGDLEERVEAARVEEERQRADAAWKEAEEAVKALSASLEAWAEGEGRELARETMEAMKRAAAAERSRAQTEGGRASPVAIPIWRRCGTPGLRDLARRLSEGGSVAVPVAKGPVPERHRTSTAKRYEERSTPDRSLREKWNERGPR